MKKNFVPINLGLINEGELLSDYNQKIQDAVKFLIAYRKEFGDLSSLEKEVEINLKVKIRIDNPKEHQYSIKGEIITKLPNPPAQVSLAMEEGDNKGNSNLMVPFSGSTEDIPEQGKLFKQNGEVIDHGREGES